MRSVMLLLVVLATVCRAEASGLLAPTDATLPPLRVTDHLVDVSIHDAVALTTLRQVFRNDTGRQLEATYIFPLPEQADLTDFRLSFNGKMVQGQVLPAEEAARIYESIVRRNKDPGLIEFIGRRLLQMRVFPIEPESDTTIEVRYQQVCRPISGMTGYHYPLRTRRTAGQAYGTVRFTVALDTSAPLKSIWSPTHTVEIVRRGEHAAQIAYEAKGGSLEDDFLLLYDTDARDLGMSVVAHKPRSDQDGHFILMLTPRQLWTTESPQPQDVVFVIDTSGSMAGEKIEQAKSALRYCIDQLDEADRFSVVRFSTGFDVLFNELAPASAENRAEARKWVEQFTAAGGTNISDTLAHVMSMKPVATVVRPYVIVFLTDGQGNHGPDETMSRLASAGGAEAGIRIFPFGVGHDVNTILLDRLSEKFAGRATYVQPGENLELVLGDFFSVVSRPVLTNLKLALPDLGVTQRFPVTLGDLYHGQQLVIAGCFANEQNGPVKLTATRNGEPLEYVWPDVSFTNTAEASYVPAVWAGRKIAYLIDQIRVHGENSEMIAEIITLSQAYGIQTPYTSWLVDPQRQQQLADVQYGRRAAPGAPGGGFGRGGGGGGMGGGAGPAREHRVVDQERKIRESIGGGVFGDPGDEADGVDLAFGDEFSQIDGALAADSVQAASGEVGNLIARTNAALRERRSLDEGRADRRAQPMQRIGDRWYNRIGRYLVDEEIGQDTELLVVRFGSDSYFELVRGRADLRPILAEQATVAVHVAANRAVLVSDSTGVEALSEEQRSRFGLRAHERP